MNRVARHRTEATPRASRILTTGYPRPHEAREADEGRGEEGVGRVPPDHRDQVQDIRNRGTHARSSAIPCPPITHSIHVARRRPRRSRHLHLLSPPPARPGKHRRREGRAQGRRGGRQGASGVREGGQEHGRGRPAAGGPRCGARAGGRRLDRVTRARLDGLDDTSRLLVVVGVGLRPAGGTQEEQAASRLVGSIFIISRSS